MAIPSGSPLAALLSRPAVFGSLIPIVTVLTAIVGMLLPQLMEPRVFGEFSLVVTLFNYGLIFDLGVSQVIDRRIPAYIGSRELDLAQQIGDKLLWLRLNIAVVTFVVAVVVLIAFFVVGALPFGFWAGVLAAMAGLADMVALGPACIYRARSDRRDYAILNAALLSGLIFARLGGLILAGPIGCFGALALWYVAGAWVSHLQMPLKASARLGIRESISLIRMGIPYFATSFIWAFYVTGNRWIASFLIPFTHFGEFAFSANVFSLLVGAIGGFSAFYYPKLVERIAGSKSYALSALLRRDLCRLLAAVALVIALGIVFAGFFIGIIYPRYIHSIATARIMLVAVPPMALASWLMPISLSSGHRPWVDGVVIYPVATLMLYFSMNGLYSWLGEDGAAWASTLSAIPLTALQLTVLASAKVLRPHDAAIVFLATLGACGVLSALATALA